MKDDKTRHELLAEYSHLPPNMDAQTLNLATSSTLLTAEVVKEKVHARQFCK